MEGNLAGSAGTPTVDRTRALYERPVLGIQDESNFRQVRSAVECRFAPAGIQGFLQSLSKGNLRVRDFESVLAAGKLGPETDSQYAQLSPSDQGQIRELYLASLEQVALPLRDKFFKLYAYY